MPSKFLILLVGTQLCEGFIVSLYQKHIHIVMCTQFGKGFTILRCIMFVAHKIELDPTEEQEQYLKQACGISRFVYNQCLQKWNEEYKEGNKPTRFGISNWITKELKVEYKWLNDVSAQIAFMALEDLESAFKKFFSKKSGYPKFKKKGICDSFSMRESRRFTIDDKLLRIERLKTKIKMRQRLRFDSKPKQVTISRVANKWFVSILVEVPDDYFELTINQQREPSVGVDLGIKQLAVLSTGKVFEANQPLKQQLKKLSKLQKQFAKKQKGSNRYQKHQLKIQRLYYFITCKRQAILHELTNYLVQNFDRIMIEDLNIRGMVKNHSLARAIADSGFGEFRRQLEYKCKWYNVELVVANRFYPSSKRCNHCGTIKNDLTLSDRVYQCDNCGLVIDRDLNAAINLNEYSQDMFQPGLKCSLESSKTLHNRKALVLTERIDHTSRSM